MLPLQVVCAHAVNVAQCMQCSAGLACYALQRSVQALDRSAMMYACTLMPALAEQADALQAHALTPCWVRCGQP